MLCEASAIDHLRISVVGNRRFDKVIDHIDSSIVLSWLYAFANMVDHFNDD